MERIGYIKKTDELNAALTQTAVQNYDRLKDLIPAIHFDSRESVEENDTLIQPLPISVITNKEKTKLLVIKKNKSAVSSTSPEKDKHLLYVGGHSRYEDKTASNSENFLEICKTALKRELKEEIGISVALEHITPHFIYTPQNDTSKKHFAVCFMVPVDENSVKFRLDSHELVLNKGKSKSGHFLNFEEIQRLEIEDWSYAILKYFFKITPPQQLSIPEL